ncbi:MFS transporter [Alicyclobacillus cycloheptanicus]|uniref:ACDE family multidrug resistance protein n=1 Tax=Alicyclobacillus cycloheptanicus TaxID=1457 RepID=A0ABT9XDW7_9BACL|nr:MFS transporter [Alicyclobacillus cycloheptanicus]MDQ0188475.1 ACDE family multidrug resistance protein [Alicyclobacillus cycloheptanicus]WDM01166.1 MFS transporter [Alicyclobacillus cycloheptanicus]
MPGGRKPNQWVMVILALIPMLMVLGNAVLIPGLPQMQSRMHVSAMQVSLLITLFSVPAGVVIPIAGFLSDQVQRRFVIVPALLLFGAGGVLAGCAAWFLPNPYVWVLAGRVLQGMGASGTAPIAMAVVGDLFSGDARSRALGINEAGNALGKVISPIVGSAVAAIAWFAVFFIFPVLCLPVAAAIWWLIPEPAKDRQGQPLGQYIRSLKEVLHRDGRWLWVAYLCGAAGLFTLFGILFDLSELLETQYHMMGMRKGLVLAIPLLVLCSTALVAGIVIKKRKPLMKWMVIGGFAVLAAALCAAPLTGRSGWWLVAFSAVGALGIGCVLPSLNMFITSAVDKSRRGVVTSLYGSVRFLGVAAGPPAFTWMRNLSPAFMFFAVAALAVVCAVLVLSLFHVPADEPAKEPRPERPKGRIRARA